VAAHERSVMSPVPLNGMYVVLKPNEAFRRSCAAWLAEFSPDPPRLIFQVGLRCLTRSPNVLNGLESETTSASGV
jgi:hypothetical protein